MTIPTKITPDPIIDAVFELRFLTNAHPDAVFGLLSNVVKDDFKAFHSLPICNLPEDIRLQDPNLIYNPYYQAIDGNFRLNIGPRVISLANTKKYEGWDKSFYPKIINLIKKLEQTKVITKFHRLGLRYVDFFQDDIFENSTLQISWTGKDAILQEKSVSTLLSHDGGLLSRIHVTNRASVSQENAPPKNGSIIDTDVFYEPPQGFSFSELETKISHCHKIASETFFSLLKEEFVATKNPIY